MWSAPSRTGQTRVIQTRGCPAAPHNSAPLLTVSRPEPGALTPTHRELVSEAMSASGALKRPRRNPGGRAASMASSFSVGSSRK